jgi:non-homologous end joining protein Ku
LAALTSATIRYASQVRHALTVDSPAISDREAALMDSLVDAMSADRMEVAERSSYQEALVEVISQKLLGKASSSGRSPAASPGCRPPR